MGDDCDPPEPDCRGVPLPPLDLPLDDAGRSLTLSCAGYELGLSVLDEGTVRFRYRGSGPLADRPSYALVNDAFAGDLPLFGGTTEVVRLCTDALFVEVDRASCRVHVEDAAGTALRDDAAEGGYVEVPSPDGLEDRALLHQAGENERFFGFGERTGGLDRRGRVLTFWTTDAYQSAYGGYPPDADPLYASIPFYLGLRGGTAYGIFLDSTHRLSFDVAASDPGVVRLQAAGGEMVEYLFAGPTPADVLRRYSGRTGTTPLPPRWSLGYHQSRWGYSPDTTVLSIADELRARNIPADALWLDIQHMDGFRSFTFDPVAFPDPSGLTAALKSKGFHTVAIVDPGIKVDPGWDVYDDGVNGGFFLLKDGLPYVGEVWPGAAVFPDFSAPGARTYWSGLVPRTLDMGIDGLWIDMNEPSNFVAGEGGTVPNELAAAGDGVPGTMAELHNVYALNEARATYEGMRAAVSDKRPFVLTRSGYAGIQRYAAMWTGDAPSSFATLQTTLPMLLGLGISGVPFVGSDVGGYSGGPSPELFARWMQVGSLSPFFRSHVETSAPPQEPWQFGTEVEDISRSVIEERYRLLPYLYSLFDEASRTGAPLLRPLFYEFPGEEAVVDVDDEAMLGPFLLVAPVLEEGATERKVVLPSGRWFEAASGSIVEGPTTVTVDLTLAALPTYVREGAILPKLDAAPTTASQSASPLYLDVYPGKVSSTFALYEDEGDGNAYKDGVFSRTTYTLTPTATGAALTIGVREGTYLPKARPLVIRVRRVDHGVTSLRKDGAELPSFVSYDAVLAAGAGYFYDTRDLSVVIVLPDTAGTVLDLDYDPTIDDPAPPVLMEFDVALPAGTPEDVPIHIATSANGWSHEPLAWGRVSGHATGLVSVPRGAWLYYKYTRGDWNTVEKWPGCVEATNRYAFGQGVKTKVDTVWDWADWCP